MPNVPPLFTIDHNQMFQDFVDVYQAETGYTLERQDAERLMFKIFAGEMHKYGSAWLASSEQNYLAGKTDLQLDEYGKDRDTPRLESTPSTAVVRFRFNETIELATMIFQNTVCSGDNENGAFTFRVPADTYVSKGLDYLDIEVEEFLEEGGNSGALANDIEIGGIDTLDESESNYTFIDSIENIVESAGGIVGESDDDYRDRLYYADSQFSTAGTAPAYRFFARSASQLIIDVGLMKNGWAIELYLLPKNYDGAFSVNLIGDSEDQLDNLTLDGLTLSNTDKGKLYWNLELQFGTIRRFRIYSDAAKSVQVAEYAGADGTDLVISEIGGSGITGTIDIAYTADDTDTTNEIRTALEAISAVELLLNPEVGESSIRPINDVANAFLAVKKDYVISKIDIEISSNNIESVTTKALQIVDIFIGNIKNKTGLDPVVSALEGALYGIDGVNNADVEFDGDPDISKISAAQKEVWFGEFTQSNLTVTVRQ